MDTVKDCEDLLWEFVGALDFADAFDTDKKPIVSDYARCIVAMLDGKREAELAKLQERMRELERMLLVDDGTVEDYTERADLLSALKREKGRADEFHADWKNLRKHCAWLEGENAKWQAHCEELEKKLEPMTLSGESASELIDRARNMARNIYGNLDRNLYGRKDTETLQKMSTMLANELIDMRSQLKMASIKTCTQVLTDCDDGLMPPFTAHCSKCGAEWGFTPKFCPECWAKVTWKKAEGV